MHKDVELLDALQKESYERAVRKGFYDPPPSFEQRIALVHSEISEVDEALDDMGATEVRYTPNGKPEGPPTEIADIMIRIADLYEYTDAGISFSEAIGSERVRLVYATYGEIIRHMHRRASRALEAHRKGNTEDMLRSLGMVAWLCFVFAGVAGFDLWDAIREKSEFNETRVHKHGKVY